MYLQNLEMADIVDAFVDENNIMVMIKTNNSGNCEFIEELSVYHATGHPVEILPKTHKLYNSVLKKFNLKL